MEKEINVNFPVMFTQLFVKQVFLEHFMLSIALGSECFQYVFLMHVVAF